jgi:hypothetical protein
MPLLVLKVSGVDLFLQWNNMQYGLFQKEQQFLAAKPLTFVLGDAENSAKPIMLT